MDYTQLSSGTFSFSNRRANCRVADCAIIPICVSLISFVFTVLLMRTAICEFALSGIK